MSKSRLKMRIRNWSFIVLMGVLLLSTLTLGVFSCSAAVVWSDDFDDGDYDGWTVYFGNWTVVDNALQAHYSEDTPYNGGAIMNVSSTASGTWSYDVYPEPNKRVDWILAKSDKPSIDEWGTYGWDYLLMIKLSTIKPEFFFAKDLGVNTKIPIAEWISDSDIAGSWHHIDITRDTDGRFRIYFNRMLIIDVVDTSLTSFDYLVFFSLPDGHKIDNIVVSDTIDILPSLISCTVAPESIPLGEAVTISGSIQTVSGPIQPQTGVPVTLSYKTDGAWSTLTTVTSASDGSYSYTWTPTAIGSYQFQTSWAGDSSFGGATSSEASITVTKISTDISCSVSSSEVTEGDALTVSGAISPLVSEKTVTLTYQKPDGSTVTRTVTSGSDGGYSDSYTPDAEGAWSVTATWDGDSMHEGSSSALKSFTVKKSGCLIATATYGSELSPQVRFLRDFRDYRILNTFAGDSFMTIFNAFYYSFSPNVADSIRGSNGLRDVMKVVLYPLVDALQVSENIFSFLSFNPELAVVATGFAASALIAAIYLLPLTLLISYFRKTLFLKPLFRAVGVILLISLASILLAEVSRSQVLMMASTGTFVLASMGFTIVSLMMVLPPIFHKISTFTITRSARASSIWSVFHCCGVMLLFQMSH